MKILDFRKYCLVIVSLIFFSINIQAQNGWTKKADMPTPRAGASASVVDGKIYVIGGSTSSLNDLAVNEVYDFLTNTWETKAPMPTARGFLFTAAFNDIIYSIGGGYPNYKLKVEAYDPATNTWTKNKDMPEGHIGCNSSCVIDSIIYIVGGNYNERECWAYNPSTDTWKQNASMPSDAGGALSVTAYNGIIYTFGGSTYSPWAARKTVYAYNPQTNNWTKKKDMPTDRFAFQIYLVNGKIYAIGGSSYDLNSMRKVEVYDPVTDSWEILPDMPNSNSWFTGAVVNNRIYLISGTPNWSTGLSDVWEYDPSFHTPVAAGNVSGTWTQAKSPYHINGEITIPNDSMIIIEPGVEIVFTGHYKFNIQGRLLAIGTKKDSIRFTADDKQAGWHGIRFNQTQNTNDTSKFLYCSFKYGKANTGTVFDRCGGAIFIKEFDKVMISNSLFESNMNNGDISSTAGAAIYVSSGKPIITHSTFLNNIGTTDCSIMFWYSNGTISNNVFSNNNGPHGPVFCAYNSPTVSGNIIANNVTTRAGGGIFCMTSSTNILNNIIVNNKCFGQEGEGGGIKCWINDKSKIINNTIVYNSGAHGGGICCNTNADPIFVNNIIWDNSSSDGSQVNLLDIQSDPHFLYCDIQGGKEGFGGSGAGVNFTGSYGNNLDSDPLFENVAGNNFKLSNYSPCIGAGTDSVEISGVLQSVPKFCIGGNPRPSPAGSNPDIGACENLLPQKITGVDKKEIFPRKFALYQNYPNPFNPSTSIKYAVGSRQFVTLKIYDLLGREIAVFVNEEKPAGTYEVTWNAENLPSGVYFYQIKAGKYTETRKMLLLK